MATSNDITQAKILDIADPIVDVYPGYATTLSILLLHEHGRRWFVGNFLNTYCLRDKINNMIFADYVTFEKIHIASGYHCQIENILSPSINTYSFPVGWIGEKFHNVLNFIEELILENKYIHLYINRKYIGGFSTNRDRTHETFIYGFNKSKEKIYFSDYFNDYRRTVCSYQELLNAFMNAGEGDIANEGILQQLTRAKVNILEFKNDFVYDFKERLQKNIECYLQSKPITDIEICIFDIEKNADYDEYYGINHYDALVLYLINRKENKGYIDQRFLHFFYTHKLCLKYKIDFLIEQCDDDFKSLRSIAYEVADEALLIRNMAIKINTHFNDEKMVTLIEKLKALKPKEFNFVSKLYDMLSRMRF